MSEMQIHVQDEDVLDEQGSPAVSSAARITSATQDSSAGPPSPAPRGRQSSRTASSTLRSRRTSHASVPPAVPAIQKWTVLGLRQALMNADFHFSRRLNKAELYDLYVSSLSAVQSPRQFRPSSNTDRSRKVPRSRPRTLRAPLQPGRASGCQVSTPRPAQATPRRSPRPALCRLSTQPIFNPQLLPSQRRSSPP